MKKLAVIFILLFAACFSGGCAVIPAIVTTGASFAVPQTVSMAVSAASTVHKTALIAADERDMGDMVSDKMTTIRAQGLLLTESGTDMEATCLNGDLYIVGEYATPADRDNAIASLQKLDGVKSVKGVIKQQPTKLVALIEPAISDKHAETVIETGLLKELHIKSANVDVEVVQGEAVILGVVEDTKEAEAIVKLVEKLRPRTAKPVKVTSLLAIQNIYKAAKTQPNAIFALQTKHQMLAATKKPASVQKAAPKVVVAQAESAHTVAVTDYLATRIPKERTLWQKARLRMKKRILTMAKAETDPVAKKQLITLSTKVLKDRHTSIESRLARTLHASTNLIVKKRINTLLAAYAPQRTVRIQTLALN